MSLGSGFKVAFNSNDSARASLYREMKSKNLNSFANKMDEMNFARVIEEKCPNAAYDLFSEIVTNVTITEKPILCELFKGLFK